MKKLFFLLMAVFAITLSAQAQRVVTGTVLSADDNEPLPGASVVVVGAGHAGVATDADGNFSINVPATASKLKVSYVGYNEQTVAIKSGKMTIKLESSNKALDEVMVVAYGTAKKSAFTGSAAVVGAAEIEKVQVTNVLDALSGVVAGVQLNNASGAPGGGSPSIRVRGISSINAGNAPLIVVDGVPYSGDINNFSTNDIESMTVLKDAASNALYGARGANGVILITTKKGKAGQATVTVDAKWGANSRAQQQYKTISDPGAYYEAYYRFLNNYGIAQGMSPEAANAFANTNMIDPSSSNNMSLAYNVFTLPEGESLIGLNGKLNPNATLGRIASYKGVEYFLTPDNWLDDTYHNSLRQEYNVSVSKGDENNSFYASFTWLDNEGIVKNSGYKRLTGTLSAETMAKPWLKVGGNMNYARYKSNQLSEDGESNSTANVFAAATQVAPIYPLYVRDASGQIMKDSYGNTMYDYGDGMNANLTRPVFSNSNAIGDSRLNTNRYEGNAFNVSGYFEIRFLKDFKFTSNNNVSIDETRVTDVTNPYYGLYASSNGIVSIQHSRNTDYTFQQLLNWNRMFGLHNVGVLLGHENYWSKSYVLYATRNNMFDPTNAELATAITNVSGNSYTGAYNNEGYLGRVQYDYDNKYFGSVSFRRDASSRFHPDHRWGSFWSAGAAWIISKESFFEPATSWVDQLKLKASYGEQGNDNIGSYRYTNTYTIVNAAGHPAAQPSAMGNPDITWEKGGNFNAGVEFSLWRERLMGSIEGFYRKTSDMLFAFPLAPSFGFSSYYANVGDMSNRGIEVELTGKVYRDKDWNVTVHGNLTYYKNKIDRLPEQRRTMVCDGVEGFSSGNYFYGEGQPIYTLRMARYAGTDKTTGEATYYKAILGEDNKPTGEYTITSDYASLNDTYDQHLVGSALPDAYGGFGATVNWKWFDFSIDFNYQLGGLIYDSEYKSMMGVPTSNGGRGSVIHEDMLNAWSYDNPSSNIPRAQWGDQYASSTSDRWLTSASYLSLRNINFGFTLPNSLSRKLQVQRVRLYMTADNICFWSARKGLDPRQSITGGASNSYYSPVRTVSGGINVTF